MKNTILIFLFAMISLLLNAQVDERFKKNPNPKKDTAQASPERERQSDELPPVKRFENPDQKPLPPPKKIEGAAKNPSSNSSTSPKIKDEESLWQKLVFGGNLSLSFGTNTFINVSPSVGYKVTDRWIPGGGFIYQYAKFSTGIDPFGQLVRLNNPIESQTYGPLAFVNFLPTEQIFLRTQFEYLNHDLAFQTARGIELQNQWTPAMWLGGGLSQPLGNKGFFQVGLMLNLLHDVDSPYGTFWYPVVGFYF